MDKSSELLPSSQNPNDGESRPADHQSDESFHFFRELSDLFNRKLARYLDIESTTACLLVDETLHGISQKDFFPEWQQRLHHDFKIPFDISEIFQSPHIVYRRLKILANQIQDSDLYLFRKIRYVFSAPGFNPYSMPWLFYPFKRDLNQAFISQLNNEGPAFQEYYLQMACRVGNLAFVQFMCEKYKLKLNSKHLNYACTSGNYQLVNYCINTYNITPTVLSLNNAATSGNKHLVKYFIDTFQLEPKDITYIKAAFSGHLQIIDLLGKKHIDRLSFSVKSIEGIIRSGKRDWLNHMVPGEDISEAIELLLCEKTMTLEFVDTLVNEFLYVPTPGILDKALQSGRLDLVIFLIDKIRENQPNLSPNYHLCTITGDIEFVKEIIALYGLIPSSDWLLCAISSGNIHLVKYLINQYPSIVKKIAWRRNDQRAVRDFCQFIFCHVPMAKFLIEQLGVVPIRSEFEHYIRGNNLPVAQYLFTKLGKQWGRDLFPNTALYANPDNRTLLEWHGLGESPEIAYYNEQMPFISLVASACDQDPDNPLSFEIEKDWHLLVKKAFLETYEFDGYDSTSEEYIPAFPDDLNQKYKFHAKDLTFWTALSIFFGIPNRPEKGSIEQGALWTWRQYIRNFFGGWNPMVYYEETGEDNLQGKILLNLALILFPVKVGIALFKLLTIIPKTALNTLKFFTEFLPLLAQKTMKNKYNRIFNSIYLPIVVRQGGLLSNSYYYVRFALIIILYSIPFIALKTLTTYFRTITSPEKSARMAWAKSNKINGGPTKQFIFGTCLAFGSLLATITFWSWIVIAFWYFAIPVIVTHFPTLAAFFVTVSHLSLIAPTFALIQTKITLLWTVCSKFTILLLVASIALVLTVSSRLSDEFSNAWAQWIPAKKNSEPKSPNSEQDLSLANKENSDNPHDINNSNIDPKPEILVSKVQEAVDVAVKAATNTDKSNAAVSEPPPPAGPSISPPAAEDLPERFASAPG